MSGALIQAGPLVIVVQGTVQTAPDLVLQNVTVTVSKVGASRERVAKGSKRIPDQSNVGGVLRIDPSFHVGEGNYAAMGVLQWPIKIVRMHNSELY